MRPFSYLTPTDVAEASRLLAEHGEQASVIAGGQTLLLALKERTARPAYLVSLSGIRDLHGIRTGPDGELVIGATTTYADLSRATLPGWQAEIAAMVGNLADRPVRTMGTVGGALCAADPRFDMLTLVVGLGAQLDVVGPDGVRTITPGEFFAVGGGTRLRSGDVLTSIRIPPLEAFSRLAFRKFRQRTFDTALASAIVALRRGEAGEIADLRVAVGAVTPVPVLAAGSVSELLGAAAESVDAHALSVAVVDEVLGDADDSPLVQYQRELVRSLTREALLDALAAPRS